MRLPCRLILFVAGLLLCAAAPADTVTVKNLRLWQAPDHTRVVFDISGPVEHEVFTLDDPARLVIDLRGARLLEGVVSVSGDGRYIAGARSGQPREGVTRIVFDLHRAVGSRAFVLAPNQLYGHRLVIDMFERGRAPAADADSLPAPRPQVPPPATGEIVVVVDAGHGGEDPGAIGPGGTQEKVVVMEIARRLQRLVDEDPGMRAVMTRTGDYYVGLARRIEIARKASADLFISVHADAAPRQTARGSSVYALSQRGASSEAARWLADKENAADLVGGVTLSDKDDLLAQVLLDLSMTRTISDSVDFGRELLAEMGRIGTIRHPSVEQANFVVLRSPDIPSVLVETAFISNRAEEQRLRDPSYQQQMAESIYRGIRRYIERNPGMFRHALASAAVPTASEPITYVVQRGDTLSEIAMRYNVSVADLRRANGLADTRIHVGRRLQIPVRIDLQ
jgi:N-acetylmuramoyl-L-alanine amidase